MSHGRVYNDTGFLYRVVLEHLTSDGAEVYLTQGFGPYATRGSATGEATKRLEAATRNYHKARVRVEASETNWRKIA